MEFMSVMPYSFPNRRKPQDVIKKKIKIANENAAGPLDDGGVVPDHVQPFMLDVSQLRGRIVRLPTVINDILSAHNYPEPVARLLAEALCLTTLLAGMLKFDGIFTLQIKGNGAVRTLVCDMTNDGTLRGTATFYPEVVAIAPDNRFQSLLAGGYLAFTVDQANSDERTQGIVPLEGETLTACVRDYFQTSEQIDTGFVSYVEKDAKGVWAGASLMLQNLAREGGHTDAGILTKEEDWQRGLTLMHSVKREEMLDAKLPLNTLLYRLFHEENVRVFPPIEIKRGCRCNMDKICGVLGNLSPKEKKEYSDNGVITVTCEFCNTTYEFPVEEK